MRSFFLRGRFRQLRIDVCLFGQGRCRLSVVIRGGLFRPPQLILCRREFDRRKLRRPGLLGALHRCFGDRNLFVWNRARRACRDTQNNRSDNCGPLDQFRIFP